MEYFEIHGGEWEELQALLREEEQSSSTVKKMKKNKKKVLTIERKCAIINSESERDPGG